MNKQSFHKTKRYDNFHDLLAALCKNESQTPAIRFFNKKDLVSITYAELIGEISSLYQYFKQQSIINQNIGILSENRYEYITIYLAAVFENVIAPIDKELTQEDLKGVIGNFDTEVLFYTNKTAKIVQSLIGNTAVRFINIDTEYETIIKKTYPIDTFLKETKEVDKDKFSVLAFTSGTTGEWKGVMLSQYNILSNLRAAVENNILKSPTLSILPMNHTYGFNPGVLNTLYNGNTLCLNMNLKHLVRDLKYFNPYFIGVVPMVAEGMYNNIIREAKRTNRYHTLQRMIKISNFLLKFKIDVRHLFFGNILCKNLRVVVSGGAALNPYYVERFEELGIHLLNGYGLTECAPLVAVNRVVHNVPGSVGTIIREDDVQIAEDGEILVKGPNVMLGYYKDPEATKACMEDGYYKTGDFGYKEGNILYVTGRKKNLIILENGKNFSPEPIEERILALDYIKECLVTVRKHTRKGVGKSERRHEQEQKEVSMVVALLFSEEEINTEVLEADIRNINATFPSYMQIDDYEIMTEEFEKTSTKKIIRSRYVRGI